MSASESPDFTRHQTLTKCIWESTRLLSISLTEPNNPRRSKAAVGQQRELSKRSLVAREILECYRDPTEIDGYELDTPPPPRPRQALWLQSLGGAFFR